jgi:hypothetical protein
MSLTFYGITDSGAFRPPRAAPELALPCDLVPDHATGPEAVAGVAAARREAKAA